MGGLRSFTGIAVSLGLALLVGGCATAVQPKENIITGQQPSVSKSGFLGDYSKMKPGSKDQASMIYINPAAEWASYNSIMIDPVQYWDASYASIPEADQQVLVGYFYNALKETLSKNFKIVDKPGEGVLRLQTAITDARTSTPVLRNISVVAPMAVLLNAAQSLAAGSYAFAGNAMFEGQIVDSITGERLAAVIDNRSGGLTVKAAIKWKWGDARMAFDYWAKEAAERLEDLKQGKTEGYQS